MEIERKESGYEKGRKRLKILLNLYEKFTDSKIVETMIINLQNKSLS